MLELIACILLGIIMIVIMATITLAMLFIVFITAVALILDNFSSHDVAIPDAIYSTSDDLPSNYMEASWKDQISDMDGVRPKQICACEGKQPIEYRHGII